MGAFSLDDPGSSFYHLLKTQHPDLSPASGSELSLEQANPSQRLPYNLPERIPQGLSQSVPYGTTVLSLQYRDGVVIAGDRRATEGHAISERRIQKVHQCDALSAIAIAGAAGPCLDMIRLFQVELEHYEKLEGEGLSMEGKANKLSQMIRGNLPMAMQGLVVIPIFVGYDVLRKRGRIFKYDIAGGKYEETDYYAIGSGGKDARGTMNKIFKADLEKDEAVHIALEAIYDAAEADAGTGGPDLIRGIYPNVKVISAQGVENVSEESIQTAYGDIIPPAQAATGRRIK